MKKHHYTYKITFPGFPWYYYGVHTDNGKPYFGSPRTHKWIWDFYDCEVQILEWFETRDEAASLERRLILPFLNETNCLNERCGEAPSIETCKRAGNISGQKHKKLKTGVCGRTPEEMSEHGKRGKESQRKNKVGWYDSEIQRELGKKGAAITHSQRWQNTHPDFEPYVSTSGGLSHWQRKRGIDTSLRVRIV
jgi:hypothetical protein